MPRKKSAKKIFVSYAYSDKRNSCNGFGCVFVDFGKSIKTQEDIKTIEMSIQDLNVHNSKTDIVILNWKEL